VRDILSSIEQWCDDGEEVAIATLVRVHGSSPRRPGARLCVSRSGRMAGSVSGGCVETDVVRRAAEVLDDGRACVTSYSLAADSDLEVGLSCGSIDVLIEPLERSEGWRAIADAVARERPAALAVAMEPERLCGRQLTVLSDGATVGTIGPGVDEAVVSAARGLLGRSGTTIIDVDVEGERGSVFLEAFARPPRLYVVGATDIAVHLTRMAGALGFHVVVIDPRAVFAAEERFPHVDRLVRAWPEEALSGVDLDSNSYVVTLTHDTKFDLPTLERAMGSPAAYIGALGSTRTHARRRAMLGERGFGEDQLARIRAPIGLDIGARSPEEIAVSILAEMLAVRSGTGGAPMVETRAASQAGK